jgi:chromosome segregation ATPase
MAEVNVRVGMNNSAFSKGLDSMKSQAKTWASDVGKMFVGAFAVTKIVSSLSSLASELDRVGKLATRLGVLPSTIAKIGKAAELAGTDVEAVVKAMARLTLSATVSSDAFAEAGINAAEFTSKDVQGQVLMLSRAYQEAGNDAQKILAIQKLLGTKAQELIPLLKQGPDALAESMGQVSDHYDQMVRKTEAFNDTITKLKTGTVNHMANVVHAARQFNAAMSGIFSGKGFMESLAEFQEQMDREEMAERRAMKKKQAEVGDAISEADRKKAEAEELKAAEELAKLQSEVKDMITKRNFDALTAEQQLLKLTEEQLAVKAKMRDLNKLSATDLVKLEKEYLELDEKIAAAKEKRDSINAKNKADADAVQKEIDNAVSRLMEEEDKRALASMSPEDRAEELQKRQAALFDKSDVLGEFGDIKGAAESRLAALQMADAIAAALAESMPDAIEEANEEAERGNSSVVSSSLAAIGGGGGSFVSGVDPQLTELKNQTRLLERIANSTTQTATQNGKELF